VIDASGRLFVTTSFARKADAGDQRLKQFLLPAIEASASLAKPPAVAGGSLISSS